jgi:hypothetical protein
MPFAGYLALSQWLRPSVAFQTGVIVAAIATSLILMLTQVLGGLRSSDLTLLKFLVTAYWTFVLVGPAIRGDTGWLIARLESASLLPPRGNLGASHPETPADETSKVTPETASGSQITEQPQTVAKPRADS